MDPSEPVSQLLFRDPPSHSTIEKDPPVTPIATPAPASQPHDSLYISQNNTILIPVINGVRPTSTKAVVRRTNIAKKGPKPIPLLKCKESWAEPSHVVKKSKQFRPREKKITVIMYWHCYRIEKWNWQLNRTVWRKPYYKEIKQKFPILVELTIGNWIRD